MVKNIFILDKHLKTDKVLTVNGKNAFFDDIYTLDLSTGTETYEFSTTITGINESNYVMFYYHGKYKLFQIVEIEQEHAEGDIVTTVYAETACLELLNNVVRSFEGEYNAISFLEHVLEGSEWAIGEYSSSLAEKVVSVKVDKTTQKWSCIQDYMGDFGYEISPRVIYDNGHVKAKLIDVYSEGGLGDHTYKRFEYGYNVTGIVKKKDLYDWCTALIIDTDKDVTNVEYNEGEYIKKAGSDVVLAANENRKYNLGRDYIYSNFEAKDCNDATDAVVKAIEELKRRATPRFDYECTTALTYREYDDLNLGDTVYCIDHTFSPSLTLEARVGKLELSFSDRTKCRCTLTNYKEVKSKIDMELTGTIQQIVGSYFPITSDGIANGAITDGKIETTYYQQITADIVSASKVVTNELIAKEVMAINGQFENLNSKYATIENLNATNGNITTLTSNLADITTLVNGNLTSDNIQSMVITGDKFTVANGFIKNAMIESINANKINTGTINTNNVKIQSADGSMVINGTTQQFKDKNNKVRIQIGKDAQGNFTFALFSQDGVGVLIDETGIKSGAVPNGLIVNNMVSDSANISGSKLDINSVISSINNGTTTIKGTRIQLDEQGQSLQVAFSRLKSKVETIENVSIEGDLSSVIEQVTSNTTSINTMQGQISSLISNTTITKANGEVVQLKDEYNSTKSTVNSHSTKIGSLETNLATANNNISSVTSKQASLEQNLNGFKQTVSDTYTTKADFNNLEIGGRNLLRKADITTRNTTGNFDAVSNTWTLTATTGNTDQWGCGLAIINKNVKTPYGKTCMISFEILSPRAVTVNWDINNYAVSGSSWSGNDNDTNRKNSSKSIPANQWTKCWFSYANTHGSNTNKVDLYDNSVFGVVMKNETSNLTFKIRNVKAELGTTPTAWTPAPEDIDASIATVDGKFASYSTTSQMNSAINQKANEITSAVSETYATKASVTDVSNNLKNNYSTTSAMNSAINQKANEITSTVSETYATKTTVNDLSNNLKNNYSTTSAMNSAINQKSDSILSTVSSTYTTKADFNNLTVGGTNLLLNSKDYNNAAWNNDKATITSDIYMGTKVYKTQGTAWNTIAYKMNDLFSRKIIELNTDYTFSAYVKSSASTYTPNINFYGHVDFHTHNNTKVGTANTSWQKVSITFKFKSINSCGTDKGHCIRFEPTTASSNGEYIMVCGLKLEKGNRATGWSPAPEDADKAISTVDGKFASYSTTSQMNSAINQKANSILSTVSSTYATIETAGTLLKESITEYYLSTSNSTLSGGTWQTTAYTPTPGKYIWQRTKSVTNAGDIKYSNPICVSDEMYTVILKNEVLLLKCNSDGEVI